MMNRVVKYWLLSRFTSHNFENGS